MHLVFSKCNGWFWGYGERMWTLLRTTVLVTFLIFPFLFHLTKSGISSEIGADIEPLALVHFSLENILPTPLVLDQGRAILSRCEPRNPWHRNVTPRFEEILGASCVMGRERFAEVAICSAAG